MEHKPLPSDIKPDMSAMLDHILNNAWGTPIEFNSAPTLAEMEAETWGFFGNNIYIKTESGTGIKLSGTSF